MEIAEVLQFLLKKNSVMLNCKNNHTGGIVMLKDLVEKNRSYRRFYEEPITMETLKELIELARVIPSTANSQALKFRLVNTPQENGKVFQNVGWAGALPDWDGPEKGERPSAYIIMLCDQTLGKNKMTDAGIAAQTIMLGAVEKGLGGCIMGNIKRSELAEELGIDMSRYTIELVLAIGKPKEKVVLVDLPENGDTRYYRDENQVHYVPKRSVEELIVD